MAETITADMIIHDIVTRHPATVKVFHGHGLPCTACAVGSRESVAGGARTHRFNPEKLELLLQDLNAAANGQPTKSANGGIEPLTSRGAIKVMSMNMFLENESDPVVWRGPMVSSAIKQFYSDVDWGQLDYLLVDLPPGTSDAPMTVLQSLPVDGIIIVSSPQLLATMVVMKCINMVRQLKGIIVGVVENMAYFKTPDGERYEIFGPSNGPELVDMTGAPLLAQLPIDPVLTTLCDAGRVEEYHAAAYELLAGNFVNTLKIKR